MIHVLSSARAFAATALMAVAAAAAAQQPPAAGDAIELKFRDFFKTPIGARGLEPTETLKAANGKRVRLLGYMVAQEDPQPGWFFLTPRPLTMSEHADGEADDLPPSAVVVRMPPGEREQALPHTRGLLLLTGTLEVGREEMQDGRVSWVRLLLDPRPPALAAAAR